MNKALNIIFTGFITTGLCISFHACSQKVEYLDNKDSKKLTSAGIDYHDIESAVAKSVDSLLQSSYMQNLEKKKVLAISDVINDTMQQVDVQDLTMKITRAMRKNGRLQLTSAISGTGGMTDAMIKRSRNLREDEEFNQYTTQEKGTLIAPELSLSGKIVQTNRMINKKQRIDYTFLLTLSDLKTGIVVWDESTHIIKVAPNNKVSW